MKTIEGENTSALTQRFAAAIEAMGGSSEVACAIMGIDSSKLFERSKAGKYILVFPGCLEKGLNSPLIHIVFDYVGKRIVVKESAMNGIRELTGRGDSLDNVNVVDFARLDCGCSIIFKNGENSMALALPDIAS